MRRMSMLEQATIVAGRIYQNSQQEPDFDFKESYYFKLAIQESINRTYPDILIVGQFDSLLKTISKRLYLRREEALSAFVESQKEVANAC